ncbi:Paxillin homolog 1 [Caenorhabditis elegans] [Rhizoctonia solani]|uniref:Paxillin homolog 1 [Caenorhabditis elegans] n=1 Tax=Rhizoctonia solani TaxID=456999 RepID=A0A0K6FPZ0_9AGAM|nr:Paxillin homolog 1 [Caenorhabditis elegans] [Rhizoctonia solani]
MALSVPASGALRISQILPTIKCSKCNEDIDIHYADEHVCSSSPTPSAPAKADEPQEPSSRAVDRASTASSISVPSVSSYSTQSRSSRSSTSTKRAPSVRSTHTIQQSPPADPPLRPQYKSNASFQSFRSHSSADDATSPPPRSGPSPAPTVRSNPVSSPVNGGATSPVQQSGPSPTSTVRSNPPLPPRSVSPSPSSRAPSRMMAASPAPISPSQTPEPPVVLPPVAPLVPRKFSRSSKDSLPPQPPPPTHAPPPPDTSTGGEAGMAGVGRRAFAAVAHAALFTGHGKFGLPSPGLSPTSMYGYPGQIMSTSPISPVDGRFSSLSGYLNISTDVTGGTPPLSPSYSPGSPSSAMRPRSPSDDVPSPDAEIVRSTSRSPSPVDVIDGSGERSKGKGVSGGLSSLARQLRKDAANSPASPEEQHLHSASPEPMEEPERGRTRALSNARSEAESETELAYGRSPSPSPERQERSGSTREDGEENTIVFPRRGSSGSDHVPKRSGSQSSSHSSSSSSASGSVSDTRRIKQSAGAQTLSALREEDEDDALSIYTSPSSAEVGGTFKVTAAHDTDEPKPVPVTAQTLDMLGTDTNRLGLPARSKTCTSASSTTSSVRRKRVRTCAKCEKRIDDGRWIKVDDGNSVLCEQDWKMMYLPKCRQCGLAIETQAIYASDGQLKGKYHKECFNCYTCHQPFPDRSFYVHQERPYCKYHYHEANNSLCAAPSCRDPIEGPCAMSHDGSRYHPEHFTCQYQDPEGKCETRLQEYWEVDGERMCERHAARTESQKGNTGDRTVKAKKRQTQFLDLSRSNQSSANANAGRDLC